MEPYEITAMFQQALVHLGALCAFLDNDTLRTRLADAIKGERINASWPASLRDALTRALVAAGAQEEEPCSSP